MISFLSTFLVVYIYIYIFAYTEYLYFQHLPASEEAVVNGSNINYSSIYAFVKFYSPRAARKAKESIGGKHLLDGQFLKVSFDFRQIQYTGSYVLSDLPIPEYSLKASIIEVEYIRNYCKTTQFMYRVINTVLKKYTNLPLDSYEVSIKTRS